MHIKDAFKLCKQQLKIDNYDAYLSICNSHKRYHQLLIALYNFNNELSQIASNISNKKIGEAKLLWWRENIKELYQTGKTKNYPAIICLRHVIKKYHIPKNELISVIKNRLFDLQETKHKTVREYEDYINHTQNQILLTIARAIEPNIILKDLKYLSYAIKTSYVVESLKYENYNSHPFICDEFIDSIKQIKSTEKQQEIIKILLEYSQYNLDKFNKTKNSIPKNLNFIFSYHKRISSRIKSLSRDKENIVLQKTDKITIVKLFNIIKSNRLFKQG